MFMFRNSFFFYTVITIISVNVKHVNIYKCRVLSRVKYAYFDLLYAHECFYCTIMYIGNMKHYTNFKENLQHFLVQNKECNIKKS